MKKLTLLSLMFLVATAFVHADSPINKDAVSYYDAELFKVGYNLLGGLNLSYQGQNSSVFLEYPTATRLRSGSIQTPNLCWSHILAST